MEKVSLESTKEVVNVRMNFKCQKDITKSQNKVPWGRPDLVLVFVKSKANFLHE